MEAQSWTERQMEGQTDRWTDNMITIGCYARP